MSERLFLEKNTILNHRYYILKTLGAGGFGVTYKAYDQQLNCLCCVKELFPRETVYRDPTTMNLIPNSDEKHRMMEHCIQRFGEEAQLLQQLHDIESVVNIYDFFYEHGTCYFVMEYLDGVNLGTAMKNQGGKLEMATVMEIAGQVGHALIEVHKRGIFHRDIAPDNIFILAKEHKVKLLDFGNAKHLVKQDGEINSVVLKMGYSPPEQYSKKGVQGTYTDVYAFAFTIYYAITGIKPPPALDRQSAEYRKLSELGYSKELSDVFDRALVLNYRDRTRTVDQFLSELRLAQGVRNGSQGSATGNLVSTATLRKPDRSQQLTEFQQPEQYLTVRKIYQPVLELYVGNQYQGLFRIQSDRNIVIGRRKEKSGFTVGERHVSGHHCDLYYSASDQMFYIMDYSANGTYINGNRLKRGVITRAKSGDQVALGSQNAFIILKEE